MKETTSWQKEIQPQKSDSRTIERSTDPPNMSMETDEETNNLNTKKNFCTCTHYFG